MTDCCADHECDYCPTCLAGTCCGELVVDQALPDQGSWPGDHHAELGELHVTEDGKVACHVCPWTGDYLYVHIRSHRMSSDIYRAFFGLRVGEPLMSPSALAARRNTIPLEQRNTTPPPQLTFEQRSAIHRNREARLQTQRSGRHDPDQQRLWALQQGPRTEEQKARLRAARRTYDEGHACPECGALVCTWTSRASGQSTKRTLCGEPECLTAARRRAAAVANRRRYGK